MPALTARQPKSRQQEFNEAVRATGPFYLGENELAGLFAEAFESYDYQDERVRFDTRNRKWTFRPDKDNDCSVLTLRLERLNDVSEDKISTAYLASDMGKPMIEDVVRKLDRALA